MAQPSLSFGLHLKGASQESKSKHTESASTKSRCSIQVMDSEDNVYVQQTNMKVEFTLTVNKQQAELENYKKKTKCLSK